MIYVANPYSHQFTQVMDARFRVVEKYVAEMSMRGHLMYSPIVHFHEIARKYKLPSDFKYWREICIDMLNRSTRVHVLKMSGYEVSKGVLAEIAHAEKIGIPVTYVDVDHDI